MAEKARRLPAFALIVALSVILNLTGIWWGLPADFGWAPDELFPQRVITGLESRFARGWYDNYPPVQYYILSLLYAPFLILIRMKILNPATLPVGIWLYYLNRLVSALMAVGCLVLVYRIGREILDRRAALLAALITALIVPFPYYAKMANLDIPYLFWFLWSLYFFVRILKTRRTKYYLLFALTAALSVGTKDQAYGLYILAPALMVWADRRAAKAAGAPFSFCSSVFSINYLGPAAVALGTFALAHNLLFNWSGFVRHIRQVLGPSSQGFRMFPATLPGQLKLLGLTFAEIRFCLGWPLLLICLLGLGLALRRRAKNFKLLVLSLFGVSYYIFYIAVIGYNYDRFNIPLCVLLSFFGGQALSLLIGARSPWSAIAKGGAVAVFVYSFTLASSVDILMVKDSRYAVERWLRSHVAPGDSLGILGPPNYLPRVAGYAWRNIAPHPSVLARTDKPDFLIFNTLYALSFPEESPESRFFADIRQADSGYRLGCRYQTPSGWLPLRPPAKLSNLALVNPEIWVYEKRPAAAVHAP